MLTDLMEYYITEGMDKQILKKLPYCLLVSLVVYSLLLSQNADITPNIWIFSALSMLMLVFIVSSSSFASRLNQSMSGFVEARDIKGLVSKVNQIFEENSSLLDDIDVSKVRYVAFIGVANGLSILGLLSGTILVLLYYSHPTLGLSVASALLVMVYAVYDSSKATFVEEPESQSQNPFGFDLAEKYMIGNSLRRLPFKSRKLLYAFSRLFGPLIHLDVPKFMFDGSLVYENPKLVEFVRQFAKKSDKSKVNLQHEGGKTPDEFFIRDAAKGDRITVLVEKSPKEVFPYLIDPNYKDTADKIWIAFSVNDVSSGKVVGHIFIHRFRGVYVKRLIKKTRVKEETIRGEAFQFIYLGQRSYLEYFKNLVEINSAKVPPNLLNVEVEP